MYNKLFRLFSLVNLFDTVCSYNLLDRYYFNNIIDIHVTECHVNLDCIQILFDANRVLQVPGNYRHINWYFDAVDSPNTHNNGINEIIFKYEPNYKGQTEFKIQNGKILEFNMLINPYGLSKESLYNIILHELAHVFLLGHSEYKDSIMGYNLIILPNGQVRNDKKLQLTNDDCLGLYAKLINDIKNIDYVYSLYLVKMSDSYCSMTQKNYILEDPNKIVPSVLKLPKKSEQQRSSNIIQQHLYFKNRLSVPYDIYQFSNFNPFTQQTDIIAFQPGSFSLRETNYDENKYDDNKYDDNKYDGYLYNFSGNSLETPKQDVLISRDNNHDYVFVGEKKDNP